LNFSTFSTSRQAEM